ncbi:hypothetical protein [Flavobacterium gawalongense]|uniref:Bacteriocin n=1 Tax=Flavobacterium gawalongense TaxID=2594432 RepID=A0A553BJZ8_9FLAO|nr:hypothetical protein [Flavobacterium gawalongense]TRX08573.1 hypothetical protein FNW11_10990 [Flavobacterium gawalongense]TRX09556.1 hypothetical protein FNW10_10875 [Flavobacterium gawalongense]TRX25565.1 hypothetical protein FNW38_10850 [Flavobacterium gawalongense]
MKTQIKFDDIKGMLRREEMKEIIGGAAYTTTSGTPYSGGTVLGTGYNNSADANTFNYGAGANGSASTSGTGANTYNNMSTTGSGGTGGGTATATPYAKP